MGRRILSAVLTLPLFLGCVNSRQERINTEKRETPKKKRINWSNPTENPRHYSTYWKRHDENDNWILMSKEIRENENAFLYSNTNCKETKSMKYEVFALNKKYWSRKSISLELFPELQLNLAGNKVVWYEQYPSDEIESLEACVNTYDFVEDINESFSITPMLDKDARRNFMCGLSRALGKGMSLEDYISKVEELKRKIKSGKISLPHPFFPFTRR